MDNYITGKIIKELRDKQNLTQLELADILCVSDKTISKWETGRGLPDISLIEPLAKALKVSVIELMNGEYIINQNKASNMIKSKFYVCPICSNIIHSMGESVHSCCGIDLPSLETEEENAKHIINFERIENEIYISIDHSMTKDHYISFIAYITKDKVEIAKLYPEQNAEARFFYKGKGLIYAYCNKDGLFRKTI
ncbi:MAG: helix-turn-helix domain-containing protein [Clostridia bacterium]|nr:helix-turn-helix domain-containing protein [Clostridia bacterium]